MKRLKTIFRLVKLSIRTAAALGCVLLSILIVRSYYVGQDFGGRIMTTSSKNPNWVDGAAINFDRGHFICYFNFDLREVLPASAIARATHEQRGLFHYKGRPFYCESRDDLLDVEETFMEDATHHALGVYWDAKLRNSQFPVDDASDGIWVSMGGLDVFLGFPAWLLLIPGVLIVQPWKLISVVRKKRRRSKNLCPACGYDTRANPGRCSECGAAIS